MKESYELLKERDTLTQKFIDMHGGSVWVDQVSDKVIFGAQGEIPIRIYQPHHDDLLPLMVYFHGGGFCFGSIDSHDAIARRYAMSLQAVVISVGYRLAPEHKYPAGVEDCYTATKWAQEHAQELNARPETLCVAGDSAGGNFAAVVPLMARDRCGPKIAFQLLVSPCCDFTIPDKYPSYSKYGGDGYDPNLKMMAKTYERYLLCKEDGQNAYVSPVQANDLGNLPPALIFSAGKDMLQAELYASKLAKAGVQVRLEQFKETVHISMNVPALSMPDVNLALKSIKAYWENALEAERAPSAHLAPSFWDSAIERCG